VTTPTTDRAGAITPEAVVVTTAAVAVVLVLVLAAC
jgi:preprotein translocase subunit Sec61beta